MYPEPFYNMSLYGGGFEGVINYANLLVSGWLTNLFLIFIFFASEVTLSKSEWSIPGITAFSFFVCLLSEFILSLFTTVNQIAIFITIIGLAGSIAWGVIEKHS